MYAKSNLVACYLNEKKNRLRYVNGFKTVPASARLFTLGISAILEQSREILKKRDLFIHTEKPKEAVINCLVVSDNICVH